MFRIRKRIKKTIKLLQRRSWRGYSRITFSQNGEDVILESFFGVKKRDGFYVDIGAHHPWRYSNTYMFYRKGWSGINVDAMPGTRKLFDRYRPRDINLEFGLSRNAESLTYFRFQEPAYNTFNKSLAHDRVRLGTSALVERISLDTIPLAVLFERYLEKEQVVDFLTIDVEGLDLEVLSSNDWSRFRPTVVLAEVLGSTYDAMDRDPVNRFMMSQGYSLQSKANSTAFFVQRQADDGR